MHWIYFGCLNLIPIAYCGYFFVLIFKYAFDGHFWRTFLRKHFLETLFVLKKCRRFLIDTFKLDTFFKTLLNNAFRKMLFWDTFCFKKVKTFFDGHFLKMITNKSVYDAFTFESDCIELNTSILLVDL